MVINEDEWRQAVADAGAKQYLKNDPESVTTYEFCELFDPPITHSMARRMLYGMVRDGRAIKTTKRTQGTDGRILSSTAYKLTKKPKR